MGTEIKGQVRVGVQAIVCKDGGILLGKRKSTFQEGSWGLPGGRLELDETILQFTNMKLRGAKKDYP